jgi:ABC-type Fe3+ transport system substrate-binding protein
MAEQGVLQIPRQLVDSTQRNIVVFHSRFQVIAYNKNLVPAAQVPKVWGDLLKPSTLAMLTRSLRRGRA